MAEKEEIKKSEMEEVTPIPLLTSYKMGNFNLSHRSVWISIFIIQYWFKLSKTNPLGLVVFFISCLKFNGFVGLFWHH